MVASLTWSRGGRDCFGSWKRGKTVKPEDHVVAQMRMGCGIDAESPVYDWGDTNVNAGAITTFSELRSSRE